MAQRGTTPASVPLSGEVREFNGRPTVFINGQPVYPMAYNLTDSPGGRWSWEEVPSWNIRSFTKAGLRIYNPSIWLEQLWTPDGKLSMDLVRKQLKGFMKINPDAAVIIRLHINSPRWWNRQNPEECTQYADCGLREEEPDHGLRRLLEEDLDNVPRHSMASEKWKSSTTAVLKEFCRRLSRLPEGNCVVGIHLASGVYHEWHYWGFIKHEPDTSLPMTRYFRNWLKDKYGTENELQRAWKDPDVTFQNARVPGVEERAFTGDGIFRIPENERRVCDYYQCQHQVVADNVVHFCRVVKESWSRPVITGAFNGYFLSLFGRQAAGGHLQIQRVLESPYIDYVSAPQAYYPIYREMGGAALSRGLLESCKLHGKLVMDEMDQAALPNRMENQTVPEEKLNDMIAIMRRNVVQSFTRGTGLWYTDFGPTLVSGWWDHPVLMEDIRKLKLVLEEYYKRDYRSPADVLLVYDTDVFYYLANHPDRDPVTDVAAVNKTCPLAYHSGAAMDMIYLADLDKMDLKKYRTILFGNTFYMTEKQREFIRRHVACEGRHLVWNCAPGYTDGYRNNPEFISQVSGMDVERIDYPNPPEIVLEHPGYPVCSFGIQKAFQPLFAVNDAAADRIGFIKGTQHAAFARKNYEDWTSWFCSIPLQSADLMRKIFTESGAHIYNRDGDVIYTGSGILAIHTATGGDRDITLRNGKKLRVTLRARSTTLFDSEDGRLLL